VSELKESVSKMRGRSYTYMLGLGCGICAQGQWEVNLAIAVGVMPLIFCVIIELWQKTKERKI
jgi:hypothetical protein